MTVLKSMQEMSTCLEIHAALLTETGMSNEEIRVITQGIAENPGLNVTSCVVGVSVVCDGESTW